MRSHERVEPAGRGFESVLIRLTEGLALGPEHPRAGRIAAIRISVQVDGRRP